MAHAQQAEDGEGQSGGPLDELGAGERLGDPAAADGAERTQTAGSWPRTTPSAQAQDLDGDDRGGAGQSSGSTTSGRMTRATFGYP